MSVADIAKALGKVVQNLIVPELRAIRTELEHHNEQFGQIDKRFEQVDKRFEQVDKRFEMVFDELKSMRKDMEEIKVGQAQILAKLELDHRMTRIETIIEKAGLFTGIAREKTENYKPK
ncbi:MAG: hypothetical protein AB1349_05300 [Elusimicrobiota bacterium]